MGEFPDRKVLMICWLPIFGSSTKCPTRGVSNRLALAANEKVVELLKWGSNISFNAANDVSVGTKIDWLVSTNFVFGK
jgi:hypothetical protein